MVLQAALHVAKSPIQTEMVQGRIDQMRTYQSQMESAQKEKSNTDASSPRMAIGTVRSEQGNVGRVPCRRRSLRGRSILLKRRAQSTRCLE